MSSRKPPDLRNFPEKLQVSFGPYKAVAYHQLGRTDADTFDVLVDLGLNEYPWRPIRLDGVSCAERNTDEGRRAAEFVRNLIPDGTPVRVTSKPDPKTFGRYVGKVEFLDATTGEPVDLGDRLVAAGFGVRDAARS